MSEHAGAQPQRTNTPQEATKGPSLLQRRDMNQPEPATLQEWLRDTASGTFAEPQSAYDVSCVPALSGKIRQNRPILRTQPIVQRFPKDGAAASSFSCPTCPKAESEQNSATAEPTVDAAPTPVPSEPTEEKATPGEVVSPGLIVEDSATDLAPGQIKKSEFLGCQER